MEDTVAVNGVVDVNGVKDVNVATDRIYYELDGEGDADSSTTPGHNVDQRGQCIFDESLIVLKYLLQGTIMYETDLTIAQKSRPSKTAGIDEAIKRKQI
ncbi:hypothetical protein HZH66_013819 [Vespula vulgaris]|uniref:Uncharacterized protein n=1 Tax=Vespula vulgaris TaxID=7454 RepID=A0A834MQY5_VESVU|nr:hypothetical protein HZH66_013819 [Vespula vulgaris]